ncbi:hypothetical protein J4052_23240 [Bacillus toyonensis]|nr:hypothetical protein [Bacillus toyonensis]
MQKTVIPQTHNNVTLWVECGADLKTKKYPFTRKHFMFPENTWQFREHYNNQGVYQTVMQYINPIWFQNETGKWIINAGDSLKWGDFYLDFDTIIKSEKDYIKLKEDVKIALRYVTVIMQVNIKQVQLYFSGNKGIHLVIPAITLGLDPHVALNQIYKLIAKDIKNYCPNNTLDSKVYDDKRMFRMINSWNIKGGAYKIPITYEEFNKLSYVELIQLAQSPREIKLEQPFVSQRARLVIKKHIEEWNKKLNKRTEFSGKIRRIKTEPPCIKAMNEKLFRETIDERNNSATALASFYMQQQIPREETILRMQQWGKERCSPPLKANETKIIVNSVYNAQYKYGCNSFKQASGVCNKEKCPLFNKEISK